MVFEYLSLCTPHTHVCAPGFVDLWKSESPLFIETESQRIFAPLQYFMKPFPSQFSDDDDADNDDGDDDDDDDLSG